MNYPALKLIRVLLIYGGDKFVSFNYGSFSDLGLYTDGQSVATKL